MSRYILLLLSASAVPGFAGIIYNGGFESNDGVSTFTGWTVTAQPGSAGSWWAQTGELSPLNSLPVPAPPGGTFAAMTDSGGPSSQVLIQDFTIAPGATSVMLSFDYFLNNLGPDYVTGDGLAFDIPNQQARVDILSSSAGAFDTTVLFNVFQTQSGDILQPGAYQTLVSDITPVVSGGGTFQLRFAEVDSLGMMNFGVDNVQIDAAAVPEPFTAGLTGAGLVALGLFFRRKHA